ncbi:MAG: MltA domain-containing protein [Burkholderiaceae bacterium]|nr:MltA domain-containing protein [Burkholderiaceae bacterium]
MPDSDASARAPLRLDSLPGWGDDDLRGVREALARQCALARPPPPWPKLCPQLPPDEGLERWLADRFRAWPLAGADGRREGLLTGYYEPIVHGTRTRVRATQVPLLARPADLVALADGTRQRLRDGRPAGAYPSRANIENDGLPEARALLWLDDPIEAFFLHVQGSGRVRLPDGSIVRVGFADHNGHAYRAIGRVLIERGALAPDAVDAAAIRAWLRAHPGQAREVMQANPRYVFFRELPSTTPDTAGPPGSLGVALTPTRSVATDPAFVAPGALLFVDGSHPASGAPLRRVVVSQDRGAAIVGAVRADLFWGSGDEAGRLAGLARQPMRMWLLLPRDETPPR